MFSASNVAVDCQTHIKGCPQRQEQIAVVGIDVLVLGTKPLRGKDDVANQDERERQDVYHHLDESQEHL